MIFNNSVLKNMMKSAYRGAGLLVANKDGRIIIGGTYWRVSIDDYYFPNKAKAALVELIGQLPQQGESFRCTSSGNQMELPGEDLCEIVDTLDRHKAYEKTNILLDVQLTNVRPYQSKIETIFLSDIFDELLDGTPEEGEDATIIGPCKRDDNEHRVFFMTQDCILEAWEIVFSKDGMRTDEYSKALDQMGIMLYHQELKAQTV